MTDKDHQEAFTIGEFVKMLNGSATIENIRGRIRRGSLSAYKSKSGEWYIPKSEFQRVMAEMEPCNNCTDTASSFVIVKYHHHHRVEFALCDSCARQAEVSYSRKGGVLEVVTYPLLGEGWLKY